MTEPERHLLTILKAKRAELHMLDVAFAKELGISQGHWSLVKNQHRGIGRHMAGRILRRFPELWREVHEALLPRDEGAA